LVYFCLVGLVQIVSFFKDMTETSFLRGCYFGMI